MEITDSEPEVELLGPHLAEVVQQHRESQATKVRKKILKAKNAHKHAGESRPQMRFLHWFSGPVGGPTLGGAVQDMAAQQGVDVEVSARDTVRHRSHDIRWRKVLDIARLLSGYYQAFHAGYPCTTVSRVGFRKPHAYGICPLRSRRCSA